MLVSVLKNDTVSPKKQAGKTHQLDKKIYPLKNRGEKRFLY